VSSARRSPGLGVRALAAAALLATFATGCELGDKSGKSDEGGESAKSVVVPVTRVVDGDTVLVRLDGDSEYVRYIGIDTPESVKPDTPVECYALAASHFNERLVEGRRVRLVFDEEHRDVYGRLLAYVYLPDAGHDGHDEFVNAELVRRGYATTLTIPPNDRFADLFDRLARRAGAAGRGLWSAC
jgi:micrococcal nuclease